MSGQAGSDEAGGAEGEPTGMPDADTGAEGAPQGAPESALETPAEPLPSDPIGQ
ncbi:MAG: hypothetical protein M5R40_09670 [Anaerolineae bacterium]|nr:hypothetical protein [Anaerolineae bacterium]